MFWSDIFFHVNRTSQENRETFICIVQQNNFETSIWAVDDESPLRRISRIAHNLKEPFYITAIT